MTQSITLFKEKGQLGAMDADGKKHWPVRLHYLRPLGLLNGPVSLRSEKKKEIYLLNTIEELSEECRLLAEEELKSRYFIPTIQRITRTTAQMGIRFWEVETDKGEREFLTRNPSSHVQYLDDDSLIVKDTHGNKFRIHSLEALDSESQKNLDKVL